MLLKIILVGALAIGLMAAVKDGRILRDAGLLSRCNPVTVNGQADSNLLSCTKGRLDGWPDMTTSSCNLVAVHPRHEFWRCQAPVVSSRTPTG
jgi:hypothetical protein